MPVFLMSVLALGITIVGLWWTARSIRQGAWGSFGSVAASFVLIAGAFAFLYFVVPEKLSWFVYQVLWGSMVYLVPMAVGGLFALYAYFGGRETYKSSRSGRRRGGSPPLSQSLQVICYIAAAIFGIGGPYLIHVSNEWAMSQYYQPVAQAEPLRTDPKNVRFTPLQVAFNYLHDSAGWSGFQLEDDYIDPALVDGGFGYVVPAIPTGMWQTFSANNPGFVIYNDQTGVEQKARARHVKQEFQCGEGMEWTDNIYRCLYRHDFLAIYRQVSYLQLDAKKPNEFVAIAPKITYAFRFPMFWVQKWSGVSIVYPNGKIEDVSAEAIAADPRFKGKVLFPSKLALEIVEAQAHSVGPIAGLFNWPGKIKVPRLPGGNQMPFLMSAVDGQQYHVVMAEPFGGAGLFKLYYVNAQTGHFSVVNFSSDAQLIGPAKALEYAKTGVDGYNFGASGGYDMIEPRCLVRPDGEMYIMATVTTKEHRGIVATVVVSMRDQKATPFTKREDFEAWYASGALRTTSPRAVTTSSVLNAAEVRQTLEALRRQIDELISRLPAAPASQ